MNQPQQASSSTSGLQVNAALEQLQQVKTILSNLSLETRRSIGYGIKGMLYSCTWDIYTCNYTDFKWSYNYHYGNCYTFNAPNDSMYYQNDIGPSYALNLELFINQDDYTSALADSAGIRFAVHPRNTYPFPEDDGYNAMPGSQTSAGVSKTTMNRLGGSYGKCKDYTQAENLRKNAYVSWNEYTGYSIATCTKTCTQRFIMGQCQCYHPKYPNSGDAFNQTFGTNSSAYGNITNSFDLRQCNITSGSSDDVCIDSTLSSIRSNTFDCESECAIPCSEDIFKVSISSAAWPSKAKQSLLQYDLLERGYITSVENGPSFMEENLVKLQVYYSQLATETISEEVAYDLTDLVSDLGGQLGLWLGLSVISLCEFLEVVVDIASHVMFDISKVSVQRNTAVSSTPVQKIA